MKNIICTILLFSVTSLLCCCDKSDCNGNLDGMWQLMVWTDPKGDTIAKKETMIFYSFQLQMARFDKRSAPGFNMMSSTEITPEQIRIYNPVSYRGEGHDSIYSMDVLKVVGVPQDGVMKIQKLMPDQLVLTSQSMGTLQFRKY